MSEKEKVRIECKYYDSSSKVWSKRSNQYKMAVQCPYCGKVVDVYIWSFSSVGKKCICGAHHFITGFSYKKKEE